MPDLGCWGGVIDATRPNAKTAMLRCSCGKRGWHTKNIGYIGARNIYSFKGGCDAMVAMQTCEPECSCSVRELSLDDELMAHVESCDRCKEYGL